MTMTTINEKCYYANIGHVEITQYQNGEYKPIEVSYRCENEKCMKYNYDVTISYQFMFHHWNSDKFIIKYCRYCGSQHKLMMLSYSIEIGGYN